MKKRNVSKSTYPIYDDKDTPQERIVKCIQHEINNGGDYHACAASILRDIKLGYIKVEI